MLFNDDNSHILLLGSPYVARGRIVHDDSLAARERHGTVSQHGTATST
jgi:hypothetical protein